MSEITEYMGGDTDGGAIALRAEVDMQVSTAKKYPRDVVKVSKEIEAIATMDRETAESCFFTLRRKDKDGQIKMIQGPSVRLAEIAVSCYGNIRAATRVVGNDGKNVTAQATCYDLEKNVQIGWEIKRRITDKAGRTYGDDMQALTANAASALAFRNAVFKVVPKSIILPAYEAAKRVAVGTKETLAQRRAKAIDTFQKMGVSKDRVFLAVGKSTIEDIGLPELETLLGLFTAIKDGDTTVDEAFPERSGEALVATVEGPTTTTSTNTAAAPADAPQANSAPVAPAADKPPVDVLVELVSGWGYSFDDLRNWMVKESFWEGAADLTGYDDMPQDVAKRLLRAHKGLKAGLDARKGAA